MAAGNKKQDAWRSGTFTERLHYGSGMPSVPTCLDSLSHQEVYLTIHDAQGLFIPREPEKTTVFFFKHLFFKKKTVFGKTIYPLVN
jgi:hypothetical protein